MFHDHLGLFFTLIVLLCGCISDADAGVERARQRTQGDANESKGELFNLMWKEWKIEWIL
jgi:hypothetical protein